MQFQKEAEQLMQDFFRLVQKTALIDKEKAVRLFNLTHEQIEQIQSIDEDQIVAISKGGFLFFSTPLQIYDFKDILPTQTP